MRLTEPAKTEYIQEAPMTDGAKEVFLEIIPPVVDYLDEKPPEKPASRPSSLDGKRIALLANWKPISTPFMAALAEEIGRKTSVKSAFARTPDWQFTHPERVGKIGPEVDALAQQCDLMVSGVSD